MKALIAVTIVKLFNVMKKEIFIKMFIDQFKSKSYEQFKK